MTIPLLVRAPPSGTSDDDGAEQGGPGVRPVVVPAPTAAGAAAAIRKRHSRTMTNSVMSGRSGRSSASVASAMFGAERKREAEAEMVRVSFSVPGAVAACWYLPFLPAG